MRIENGMLILEKRRCRSCNHGTLAAQINCPKCDGTGNGPRGGKRGCKKCWGTGNAFDHENPVTCSVCNGDYVDFEDETPYDHINLTQYDIEIIVARDFDNREMLWTEQYIGHGLFSCVDYGAHKQKSDDELIESAFHFDNSDTYSTQGIKLIRDKNDLRICDQIAIVTADQGYSVLPIFKES